MDKFYALSDENEVVSGGACGKKEIFKIKNLGWKRTVRFGALFEGGTGKSTKQDPGASPVRGPDVRQDSWKTCEMPFAERKKKRHAPLKAVLPVGWTPQAGREMIDFLWPGGRDPRCRS